MAYRIAVGTGLRANEIRTLTPESFDLDGEPPSVTVEAAYSKHRRQDVQPMPRGLAEALRPWLADKPAGEPVLRLPEKVVEAVRVDLRAAGIPYRDASGRVCDFHSLRHTCVSAVVRSGASPKVAQVLARHLPPMLTLGVYAHLGIADTAPTLAALPSLAPIGPGCQTAKATGTYDGRAAHAQRAGATPCNTMQRNRDGGGVTNPLQSSGKPLLSEQKRPSARSSARIERRFPKPQVRGSSPLGRSRGKCRRTA